jgi:hypothetical protein
MHLIDVMGYAGAGIVLVAFALTSARSVRVTPKALAVMNLGAGILALNGLVHQAWPSTILNTVWFGVAVVTVARRSDGRPDARQDQAGSDAAAGDRSEPAALPRSTRRVTSPNAIPVAR